MRKWRRYLSISLAVLIAVVTAACGSPKSSEAPSGETAKGGASPDAGETTAGDGKVYTLKAGHVLGTDHPYQLGLEYMAEKLDERSGGRIKIEIYPNSQLGNERDLFEGCQLGTVDLALGATAPLANFNKDFYVFDLPYLFDSKEHAYAALDGDFGQNKMTSLENSDLIGLAYWECGYFDVIQSRHPIKTVEEYAGLNIRVMENSIFMATIEALGANPVPMAWSEVFTSIQNGTVDGTSNPIATIYNSSIHTIAKYFTIADMIYSPTPLIMSKSTYDSMPEDLQKLMREAAQETAVYERDLIGKMEEKALKEMQDAGLEVEYLEGEEREKIVKLMKDEVWPQFVGTSVNQTDIDAIEQYK